MEARLWCGWVATAGLLVGAAACGRGSIPVSDHPSGTVTITLPASPSATPEATTTPSSMGGQGSAAAHTVAEALALVKRVYDPYAGATVDAPVLSDCVPQTADLCPRGLENVLAPDLRARLAVEAQWFDPVICAQNFPARVAYDPASLSGHSMTLLVHSYYLASGDNPIRVTVDLVGLQFTDIVCLNAGK